VSAAASALQRIGSTNAAEPVLNEAFRIGHDDYLDKYKPGAIIPTQSELRVIHKLGQILKSCATEDTIHTLIESLKDKNASIRAVAIDMLREMRCNKAVPALIRICDSDPHFKLRAKAVEALEEIGDPAATPCLMDLAVHKHLKPKGIEALISDKAFTALHNMPSSTVRQHAELYLDNNDDMVVVYAAFHILCACEDDEHVTQSILDRFLNDSRRAYRAYASALGRLAFNPASVQIMLSIILDSDEYEDIRDRAEESLTIILMSLSFHGNTNLSTYFEPLLDDSRHILLAIMGIAHAPSNAATALIEPLLSHKKLNVRVKAAEALACFAKAKCHISKPTIKQLISCLSSRSTKLKVAALRALGYIGSNNALDLMEQLLRSRNDDVREAAIGALGEIGTSDALNILYNTLKRTRKDRLRNSIVRMIAQHASETALNICDSIAKDNDDLRDTIGSILATQNSLRAIQIVYDSGLTDVAAEMCSKTGCTITRYGKAVSCDELILRYIPGEPAKITKSIECDTLRVTNDLNNSATHLPHMPTSRDISSDRATFILNTDSSEQLFAETAKCLLFGSSQPGVQEFLQEESIRKLSIEKVISLTYRYEQNQPITSNETDIIRLAAKEQGKQIAVAKERKRQQQLGYENIDLQQKVEKLFATAFENGRIDNNTFRPRAIAFLRNWINKNSNKQ